ncbi:MAG: universal stress protein [Chlorobi bacterium]|nr:MAG: Universal stress protein [Chlorobi bacterium OLB7]MBK8912166.1 universal stress protein [Chlorobiota bacterium]MBX7215885.1 universal stress protein [Candidatus Kapabacteria bacterium]
MKILIAYDGSADAERAIAGLQRAGLPTEAEAIIISVIEPWHNAPEFDCTLQALPMLQQAFPKWEAHAELRRGTPSREVLLFAQEWKPDLIVLGSQGLSRRPDLAIGSVSQQILTAAATSVRVVKGEVRDSDYPVRLLLAVDGSPDSEHGVQSLLERTWPESTKVWIVTAVSGGYSMEEIESERQAAMELHERIGKKLQQAGLSYTSIIGMGDPRSVILSEAEAWEVDCIVIGARSMTPYQRTLLGSVSAAVAARSRCTVEVSRL